MFKSRKMSPETLRAIAKAELDRRTPMDDDVILPKADVPVELEFDEEAFMKDVKQEVAPQSQSQPDPQPLKTFIELHTEHAEEELKIAQGVIDDTRKRLEHFKKESAKHIALMEVELREALSVHEAIMAKQVVLRNHQRAELTEETNGTAATTTINSESTEPNN